MANKEINIFSVSFLDLLSGALAAVLILFIIVPKMSQADIETIEELERLNVQQAELESLIEQARNSVPQDLYAQIEAQLGQMQNSMAELNERVEELQRDLANERVQNRELQGQNNTLQENNRELQRQVSELQEQLQEARENQRPTDAVTGDGSVLGINAQLAIACSWEENCDVDLHITDLSSGITCNYQTQTTPFGRLQGDITSRSQGDTTYEMFYQSTIQPGRYKIVIHIYNNNKSANVKSFVVLYPGRANEQRIDFNEERLTPSYRQVVLGTLRVTQNSISIE